MDELTHDPSGYVDQLKQLLISDKKKIAFLCGAGTSLARKIEDSPFVPAIGDLTDRIEKEISSNPKYKTAINEIKKEIGKDYNIETLLSNLEQKFQVIGEGELNGLKAEDIHNLIENIKHQIRGKVSIHEKILKDDKYLRNLNHCDFAEWIGRIDRKYPIEIFTTNYDYLFELGLESKNIPYYDGFTGSYKPFFDSESVENLNFAPYWTKLWKIHGSLGWHFDQKSKKVLRKDSDGKDILIYPSILKYTDSKKQPYISFLDRLNNFLKQDDAILIVCGYSFRDEHVNERILTALDTNKSSHVYVLYYDIVHKGKNKEYALKKDSELVRMAEENSKLSVYGCKSAVIGCQYGKWKLQTEPDKTDTVQVNLYFDEDAPTNDEELYVEKKGGEIWTGEGEFMLPDFSKFVKFLKSWIIIDTEGI